MIVWPALLLAPLLALAQQSIVYSLVTPACNRQTVFELHAVSAVSLIAVLVMTTLAATAWLRARAAVRSAHASGDGELASLARRRFVARVATAVGSLSVLASAAMWWPVWVLSPCFQ
jgi:hypothetical protein